MELLSFISGAAGGVLTFYYFHRKIQVENILQERTKWRERIRELASEIADKPTQKAVAELEIRLNPLDRLDKSIVRNARSLLFFNGPILRKKFLKEIALLLKHDWERAKNDVRFFSFLYIVDRIEIVKYEKNDKK